MMHRDVVQRPVIFEYESVPRFVNDMLLWRRKSDDSFSIRACVDKLHDCSPALVSQVAKGARSLTRDRVDSFGQLLDLSIQETKYLDHWIALSRQNSRAVDAASVKKKPIATARVSRRRPQNSMVSNWLNVYMKEACKLRGFNPDPQAIHKLLRGIAAPDQIKKSLNFLIREGFLRRTLENTIVQSAPFWQATDQSPNKKIRAFHRRALDIVKKNLDVHPVEVRQDHTYVLAVNERNLPKLKKILNQCMDDVEQFEQEHPDQNERLFQISLHLTPVSEPVVALH